METLRIISISLLAGCSVAGLVWYLWGIITNASVYKRQRENAKEPAVADSENTEESDEPEA